MISVNEALELILTNRAERYAGEIALGDAHGFTLSRDVKAKTNRPPLAVSAMDGYAVRLSDVLSPGAKLKVIGKAPAGAPYQGNVQAGEAIRIFTGAALPDGADHIVIQEDADRDGEFIVCRDAYETPQFVRAKSLDFSEGDLVLSSGSLLSPHSIAALAAANYAALPVWAKLKVSLLANGEELKQPGSPLAPGEIINSNPYGLSALVDDWDADAFDLGIAGDSIASIQEHIAQASVDTNVFVAIGGASVGDHDHMRAAFLRAGFEMIFEKVAVKPGKPTWFAKRGRQRVLGLPGNPASALVCAHLFLKSLLYAAEGLRTVRAKLNDALKPNGPRETFLRARVWVGDDASLYAEALPNQDSSLLTPFLSANCLIRRMSNSPSVEHGELVDILQIDDM